MNTVDPGRRAPHVLTVAAAATALLVVTVVLGVTLGYKTRDQFREVENSWTAYSVGAQRKGDLISEIRGFLGFGGIIHNFKNYVLRQEAVYLAQTEDYGLQAMAKAAAEKLQLEYEYRFVGYGDLAVDMAKLEAS